MATPLAGMPLQCRTSGQGCILFSGANEPWKGDIEGVSEPSRLVAQLQRCTDKSTTRPNFLAPACADIRRLLGLLQRVSALLLRLPTPRRCAPAASALAWALTPAAAERRHRRTARAHDCHWTELLRRHQPLRYRLWSWQRALRGGCRQCHGRHRGIRPRQVCDDLRLAGK